ncbi:MAG: DUF4012 domain-containing protein [Chloroflexi bacterium]|nr:DUF4012 domain-containing protein [Chloroflexota bacterium]
MASSRRRRLRSWLGWTAGGALLFLLAMGAFGVWLSGLWERGRELETRLLVLGAAIDPETMAREPGELEALGQELTAARGDLDTLATDARPAIAFARGFGWMPWVGGDLQSLSPLLERASADLWAASLAARVMAEVQAGYQDMVLQPLDSPAAADISASLVETARQASAQLREAQETLSSVHTRTAPGRPWKTAPLWDHLRTQEEDLTASLELGERAADLLASLVEVRRTVTSLLTPGDAGALVRPEDLQAQLQDLDAQVQAAQATVDSVRPVLPEAEALAQPLEALGLMSQGAALATGSLVAIMDAFEGEGRGLFHNGQGLARAVDTAKAEIPHLDQAADLLHRGRLRMEELQSSGSQTPSLFARGMEETAEFAARLEEATRLLRELAPVAGSLFGLEAPRTYLVLGLSADELRATGGFVSTLWFATFEGGELTELRYQDVVLVDDWDRLADYPKPPLELEEHMAASVWLTRDVTWEPHFPLVAQLAEDMLEIGQQRRVDGVIAVNQWTFLGLIEALGMVPSPDGGPPITSQNFLEVLERGRDEHDKPYLDVILRGLLAGLDQPMNQQGTIRLTSALRRLLQERQIFIYVNDPLIQRSLSNLGWTGEMRSAPGDYLQVVDSNVGWSKVDRNIERESSYRVNLEATGPSHAALVLTYRNRSGPEASGCAHQWMPVERGNTYARLKQACYWNYLRVYAPAGTRLQDADPLPLPPGSIPVEQGTGVEGQPTLTVRAVHEKTVFGGLLVVPPGEQREVTFLYTLPSDILERNGDRLHYRLLLQPQAGTRGRMTSLEIGLPPGYAIVSSSLPAAAVTDTTVFFTISIREDTSLEITLAPA